jgi:hypothetical protein
VGGAVPVLFGGGAVQLPVASQQVPFEQTRLEPHRLSSQGQPSEPTMQKLEPLPVALLAPLPFVPAAELPKPAPAPFAPPWPFDPSPPGALFPEQAATKIAKAAHHLEVFRIGRPFPEPFRRNGHQPV